MPQDHPDAGAQPVKTATPGAGEVQTKYFVPPGTSRAVLITPAAGLKVRIIAIHVSWWSGTYADFAVWFSDNPAIGTDTSKAIFLTLLFEDYMTHDSMVWPAGDGPIGEVDEIVSCQSGQGGGGSTVYMVQWREE